MWGQLELHTWVLNNSLMLSQMSVVTGGNFRNLYKSTAHFWGIITVPKSNIACWKVTFPNWSLPSIMFLGVKLLGSNGAPRNGSMGQPRQAHAAGSTMSWPQFFVPNEESRKDIKESSAEFTAMFYYPYGSFTSFPSNWITWELSGFVVRIHSNFSELL